jgi:4-amino-4-deoxy-L-arabinose transferase
MTNRETPRPFSWIAQRRAASVAVVAALLVYSLAFQGSRGLYEPDEGRYTAVALQMIRSGDYLVPALSEGVPHLTKPPLTYWAIAASVRLLGWNEWGARLPNAIAFAATVLVVYALALRMMPARPWLPALIHATFIFTYGAADVVTTDTLLTLWEALAVLGFVESRCRGQRRFLLLMWGGFGLAFLTKGPPGLLPLAAIIVYVVIADGLRRVPWPLPHGRRPSVLCGGSCVVRGCRHQPPRPHEILRNERVRMPHHDRHSSSPPRMVRGVRGVRAGAGSGDTAWTVPLFRSAGLSLRALFSRSGIRPAQHDGWDAFLLLWILLPLAVFFLSRSRMLLYVLPLFVPMSLMAAGSVRLDFTRKGRACLVLGWILVLVSMKYAVAACPSPRDSREMARAIMSAVHHTPRKIVFVGDRPYWGLSLYLQGEIGRAEIGPDPTGPYRSLSSELLERRSGLVLVCEMPSEDAVMNECRRLGFDARRMGSYREWVFLVTADEAPPGDPAK